MRLASTVLGFLLRKLAVLGALLLCLFLSFLFIQKLIPTVRAAVAEQERLEEVVKDRETLEETLEELQSKGIESLKANVSAEVAEGRRNVSQSKSQIKRLRQDRDEVCGFWGKVIAVPMPGNACKDAQRAAEAAAEALDTLERNLGKAEDDAAILMDPGLTNEQKLERLGEDGDRSDIEREIDKRESELDQKKAEEKRLQAHRSGVGWVLNQWAQSWKWLAGIALIVLFLPSVLRTVNYFLLMPLVCRVQKPIHLVPRSENLAADIQTGPAERTLPIRLAVGEVLSARSEHVRPVRGKIRSRLLYDWTSPFISFAAGLYGLSRVTGDEDGTEATLATPDDPNSYLMRIDFRDHPGLVMHPKHVVGVIGAPQLETQWRWGIASFATWQVRYIMFAGTGSLIVQGSGDVVATSPGDRSTRMEQNLVMGFDSRLTVGVNRTEVFWPYLWGRTPLVDDEFTGTYPLFWQKSTADGASNPIAKAFNAVFSALGKVLGF